MRHVTLCLFLGCASTGAEIEELDAPAPGPEPIGAFIPEEPSAPAEEPQEVVPSCPVQAGDPPRPLPAPDPPPEHAKCVEIPRKTARWAQARFESAWHLAEETAKLEVARTCDRLGTIEELIIETSSGHGHSLYLDRIRRREDGDYDLLRLEYGFPKRWTHSAAVGAIVRTAVLPAKRFEPTLLRMRAGLHLEGVESAGDATSSSFSVTSNDFHVAYRMVDSDGFGREDFWVGYAGSGDQDQWIPLEIAAGAYAELMWSDDISALMTTREPTDVDRDFFAERFATARERSPEYGYWYLRERLLGMASTLGDLRLMTDLLALVAQSGEHSVARSQQAAVDVLVGLTGYDPRHDAEGELRPVSDVAADMIERCGQPSTRVPNRR